MTTFSKIALAAALAASLAAPATTAQTTARTTPPAAAMAMARGSFHALGAPTTGTARLVTANGRTTLQLTGLKTEVGPDLHVWLYEGAAPAKGAKDADIAKGRYVDLGKLARFQGSFSFAVPAGTDLGKYKSVVIFCEAVKTAFGAADL